MVEAHFEGLQWLVAYVGSNDDRVEGSSLGLQALQIDLVDDPHGILPPAELAVDVDQGIEGNDIWNTLLLLNVRHTTLSAVVRMALVTAILQACESLHLISRGTNTQEPILNLQSPFVTAAMSFSPSLLEGLATYPELVKDIKGELVFAALDAGVHECRVGVHIAGDPSAAHFCNELEGKPE